APRRIHRAPRVLLLTIRSDYKSSGGFLQAGRIVKGVRRVPKRVDHEERRRLIAAAGRRIAADRGLEGVSLGEVAAEAGISKGLVQHSFPSKDAMLRCATGTLR